MATLPCDVAEFLSGKRIAVAGVSRSSRRPANAIFRRLREAGFDALAINPNVDEVEGTTCYSHLGAIPGRVDGLVVVTHPFVAADLVQQAHVYGVRRIWLRRTLGSGSVSKAALTACEALDIHVITRGCPLMYVEPVDVRHRCMRWCFGV